uniref:Trichome birefringence-like N-terminal domain-containing protein n=1 Tax=Solanum tuberosum TaxID=4113 RepID=M0ZMG8_SOLTU
MNGRPVLFGSSLKNKGMGIQLSFQLLVAIITAILVLTALSMSRGISQAPKLVEKQTQISSLSSCNFYSGKWVFDNQSRPLYNGTNCSFMDDGMACQKFGRKNLNYLYWKWQPNDCDLPRNTMLLLISTGHHC